MVATTPTGRSDIYLYRPILFSTLDIVRYVLSSLFTSTSAVDYLQVLLCIIPLCQCYVRAVRLAHGRLGTY